MSGSRVLAETVEAIQEIASKEIATIVIERAVVGLFFTAVKLSTGHVGACATPIKAIPDAVCCPSSAHAMPFPGKMRGGRAAGFLDEIRQQDGIRRAVGIATMNALRRCAGSAARIPMWTWKSASMPLTRPAYAPAK